MDAVRPVDPRLFGQAASARVPLLPSLLLLPLLLLIGAYLGLRLLRVAPVHAALAHQIRLWVLIPIGLVLSLFLLTPLGKRWIEGVVIGGGAIASTGGGYTLGSTAGQAGAGTVSGVEIIGRWTACCLVVSTQEMPVPDAGRYKQIGRAHV